MISEEWDPAARQALSCTALGRRSCCAIAPSAPLLAAESGLELLEGRHASSLVVEALRPFVSERWRCRLVAEAVATVPLLPAVSYAYSYSYA